MSPASATEKPPIVVRKSEHGRLYAIAMGAMLRAPRAAGALLDELIRSQVLEDAEVEDDVAGLQSIVVYGEEGQEPGRTGRVRLVTPQEADPRKGLVSVLSSLGAGLLGLRPGQSIVWNDRRGRTSRLSVLEVRKVDDRAHPSETGAQP